MEDIFYCVADSQCEIQCQNCMREKVKHYIPSGLGGVLTGEAAERFQRMIENPTPMSPEKMAEFRKNVVKMKLIVAKSNRVSDEDLIELLANIDAITVVTPSISDRLVLIRAYIDGTNCELVKKNRI